MRTLCSLPAISWEPTPANNSIAGIPISVYSSIVQCVLAEVEPQLRDHCCDVSTPCVVLRRAMQTCKPFLSINKTSNALVSVFLKKPQYQKFQILVDASSHYNSSSANIALAHSIGGRYRAYGSIEGEFEKSVLYGYDYGGEGGCHSKTKVVIKVSMACKQHENELDVYNWLKSSDSFSHHVPNLLFGGECGSKLYALVFTRLGPDLDRLRRGHCRLQRFTPKMTLAVAIQTLRIYEKLHTEGWLHCNAKAGNFAIGPDSPGDNSRIFIFDFEYSHRISPTPGLRSATHCTGWNSRFKPVTWELELAPSRRDDLEGLGYVFTYLERGSHPWQHSSSEEMWRMKMCTPTKKLFEGMDPVYVRYFDEVKALAWGEVPDYQGMVQRFVDVWERRGYGGTPGEIDWWRETKLRKDA